jgi:hypothetical protein
MSNNLPLHSHHIFLFPFKWSLNTSKDKSMSEKYDFSDIDNWQKNNLKWQPFSFKFDKSSSGAYNTYNEYAYFHDYARDILSLDSDGSVTKRQYSYVLQPNSEYIIEVNTEEHRPPSVFSLAIEDITLNFYESGVGVISFHLNNFTESDFNKILKINEYGRRIYPQFLGLKKGKSEVSDTEEIILPTTSATKGSFLPNRVILQGFSIPIEEDFSHYDSWDNIQKKPFKLPNHIQLLLGDCFKTKGDVLRKDDILIEPVIDDRMFTICLYGNTEMVKILREYDETREIYNWQTSSEWHRFLFVDDSSATCKSRNMLKKLLTDSTYDRWIEDTDKHDNITGHLFGISRYSFVVMSAKSDFANYVLINHVKNIYYQMTLLCLVQRASVLKYSGEVASIIENFEDESKTVDRITELYEYYIKFVNKIYFREITPQEQGIELYNILQKQMDIERQVKELDGEIQELHNYLTFKEEQDRSRKLDRITYIGLPIAIASLVLSFFGLNYFGAGNDTLKVDFSQSFSPTNEPALSVWNTGLIAISFFIIAWILLQIRWTQLWKRFLKLF